MNRDNRFNSKIDNAPNDSQQTTPCNEYNQLMIERSRKNIRALKKIFRQLKGVNVSGNVDWDLNEHDLHSY